MFRLVLTQTATRPLEVLLRGAIDYAGLFPPAGLPMASAVDNYRRYRASAERWALGRLIVPATRLGELEQVVGGDADGLAGARVSATLGDQPAAELNLVRVFNDRCRGRNLLVDAWEARVGSVEAVDALGAAAGDLTGYGEVAPDPNAGPILDRLAQTRLNAKIRMGGIAAETFPGSESVAGFLAAVVGRQLPFKATAGLHHPIRGDYRLTYQAGSACATMYGYLNLMVAALMARAGADRSAVVGALNESEPGAFRVDDRSLWWRSTRFDEGALGRLRDQFHGFGSCSFREPMDELQPALTR